MAVSTAAAETTAATPVRDMSFLPVRQLGCPPRRHRTEVGPWLCAPASPQVCLFVWVPSPIGKEGRSAEGRGERYAGLRSPRRARGKAQEPIASPSGGTKLALKSSNRDSLA